jgi:hypothetical protein
VDPQQGLTLLAPAGERLPVAFDLRGDEAAVVLPRTRQAGFHRLFSGARQVGAVAVNVDRLESDPDLLTARQMQDLARRKDGRAVGAAGADAASLGELRGGKPLWHLFLLAALVCLVAEQGLWLAWKR